jgi:hypothetical protein
MEWTIDRLKERVFGHQSLGRAYKSGHLSNPGEGFNYTKSVDFLVKYCYPYKGGKNGDNNS